MRKIELIWPVYDATLEDLDAILYGASGNLQPDEEISSIVFMGESNLFFISVSKKQLIKELN